MSANYHTPLAAGANANASVLNAPLGQLDSIVSGLKTGTQAFDQINVSAGTVIPLSGTSIAVTHTRHIISYTVTGSPKYLTTITGGTAGDILMLSIQNAGDTFNILNGTILTLTGQAIQIRDTATVAVFQFNGSNWKQISSLPFEFWSLGATTPTNTPAGLVVSRGLINVANPINAQTPRLEVMPAQHARNAWYVRAANNVFQPVGIATVTPVGTLTEASNTDTTYINALSAATAGSITGFTTATYNLVMADHGPEFTIRLATGAAADITNVRIWAGLFSAAATNVDDPVAGTKCIAFRYSPTAGDTGWMAAVDDGTTLTTAYAGTGMAASTAFTLRCSVNSTTQIATFQAGPLGSTSLSTVGLSGVKFGLLVYLITTNAIGKNILISRAYVEAD